jgi:hypothetical protein
MNRISTFILTTTLITLLAYPGSAPSLQVAGTARVGTLTQVGSAASSPAWGGEVQRGYVAEADATTTFTVASTISAGNRAVIACSAASATNLISVTDTQGNTWTVHKKVQDGFQVAAIASAHITTALTTSDSITLEWNDANYLGKNWLLAYLTGCASSGQPDQTAEQVAYGTSVNVTASTTAANTVIVGILYTDNNTATYSSGSWTTEGTYHDNTQNSKRNLYIRTTETSAGSKNPGGSWSGAGGMMNAWVAFK